MWSHALISALNAFEQAFRMKFWWRWILQPGIFREPCAMSHSPFSIIFRPSIAVLYGMQQPLSANITNWPIEWVMPSRTAEPLPRFSSRRKTRQGIPTVGGAFSAALAVSSSEPSSITMISPGILWSFRKAVADSMSRTIFLLSSKAGIIMDRFISGIPGSTSLS